MIELKISKSVQTLTGKTWCYTQPESAKSNSNVSKQNLYVTLMYQLKYEYLIFLIKKHGLH